MADKKVEMVAELEVSSNGQIEVIQTFDKAWHRAWELETPVHISFKRWARKK